MYCNTNTNKLNVVHNIKVCKEAVEEHQTIGGQGVVVSLFFFVLRSFSIANLLVKLKSFFVSNKKR